MDQTPNNQTPNVPEAAPVNTPKSTEPIAKLNPTNVIETQAQEKSAFNKAKRKHALFVGGVLIAAGAGIILMLTAQGMSLNTYAEVSRLNSVATFIGWGIAITTGILVAYITAHPTKLVNSNSNKAGTGMTALLILGVIGLFLGLIPGLVLLTLYAILSINKKEGQKQPSTPSAEPGHHILKPVNGAIVALAFILGIIPGAILAILLTYSLSQRACELSGSKYC